MRRDELALLGVEVKRRVLSWRFALVLGVMSFISWSITNQMIAFEAGAHVGYNAWDVFLGVFGNTANILPSPIIFPLLFIFLLGSSVQEDTLSGYSLVVQSRLARRNSYWWVKVLTILAVVAVAIASLYAVSLIMGVARGFALVPAVLSPAGGHPNAWGLAPPAVPPVYYSLPRGANVVAHGLLVAAYLVFAYFAVVMFVVGLTVRSKNLYVPLAFGALVATSQLAVVSQASGFLYEFNLVTALSESAHRVIPMPSPGREFVPWSSSIILLSVLLVVGLGAGAILTPTRFGSGLGRATGRLARISTAAAISCLLAVSALLAGCTSPAPTRLDYAQFTSWATPSPPQPIELGGLTESDTAYLESIAEKTVRLSNAWEDVIRIFGPKDLHASDAAMRELLRERLAAVERELDGIRSLRPTPALEEWYRTQYEPGLDELEYVVDNLGSLYDKRDHVAIRECLKRVEFANVYFSAAGQTIAPFAPQPSEVPGTGDVEGGEGTTRRP